MKTLFSCNSKSITQLIYLQQKPGNQPESYKEQSRFAAIAKLKTILPTVTSAAQKLIPEIETFINNIDLDYDVPIGTVGHHMMIVYLLNFDLTELKILIEKAEAEFSQSDTSKTFPLTLLTTLNSASINKRVNGIITDA